MTAFRLKPARTRIAPSPTGRFHVANSRNALFAYIVARQTGGELILRFEDTDRKRFVPGSEEEIVRSLEWLGLKPDESPVHGGQYGPYRQTERRETYQHSAKTILLPGTTHSSYG